MSGQQLLRLVTTASAVAISYEGISQGVMGAVTVAPEFGRRMGYTNDRNEVVKPTLQGGIAAMYYWYVSSLSEKKQCLILFKWLSLRSLLGWQLL
jgi:hypothetical protein